MFMKKLLNKIEKKPLLISIGLVLFQTTLFFLSKLLISNPHVVGNYIDTKIPFISYFIIPYYSWYILILAMPYYYYKVDKDTLVKYIISYMVCATVATIIFLVYPSTVIRPEDIPNSNIFNIMTNFIYFTDNPAINCFPSLHCAISMLFILTISKQKDTKLKYKLLIIFISILIMASTLFTKQHVFIDLVSGDILMILIYVTFSNNKLLVNKVKKLLKL